VLRKSGISNFKFQISNSQLEGEELQLLRLLARFDEVVIDAAEKLAPNMVATYLYGLASTFNLFYQKHSILKAKEEKKQIRLALTQAVGKTLQQGLNLLGIQAPEKM
jgi:arginyl-tRNA synthetase